MQFPALNWVFSTETPIKTAHVYEGQVVSINTRMYVYRFDQDKDQDQVQLIHLYVNCKPK